MSHKKNKPEDRVKVMNRFGVVIAAAFVLGVVIMGRLCQLTFVEGEYWQRVSQRYVMDSLLLPAQRGNILSSDGQVLATSLPQYRLYMDFIVYDKDSLRGAIAQAWRDSIICSDTLRVIPGRLNKRKEIIPESVQQHNIDSCRAVMAEMCGGMHRIFPDIDSAAFHKLLVDGRAKRSHHWCLYRPKVSYIQYCEVKKLPYFCYGTNRNGFHTQEYRTRKNPYGKLAARTVGDLYGEKDSARCGLELSFDSVLSGKPGYCHRQKVLKNFVNICDKMPENGCDVRTTLNIEMQDLVEKALGDQLKDIGADFGVCILMEVATGDIKAISSLDRLADGSYKEISNRAISLLMEPGSVFKTVSFMVGLDDGAFNLNTRIETGSGIWEMYKRKMKDSNWGRGGHGNITACEVLECSSNIGTSRLIDQFYHDKPEKYVRGVYRTGIQEDLQLPLVGYARPNIRMPKKDKTGRYWANWSNTALPWMSIGYETQVPPISTLTFYNGIANGGKMMYPRFVKSIERDGQVVREYPTRVLRSQMCKPTTIRDLQIALRNTVVKGTAKAAGSKNFSVSGKTGTAQIWTKAGNSSKYLISFVGYFPSEQPQYTMIVCIKKSSPAYGGTHCGPVFKYVAEAVMAQKRESSYLSARDTVNAHHPVVHPGNMSAMRSTLSQLGMNYNDARQSGQGRWGNVEHANGSYTIHADETGTGIMPNLKGYGLRDAVYRLESMKLKVKVNGRGRVVQQSISAGSAVRPGMTVTLHLTTDGKPFQEEKTVPKDTLQAVRPDSTKQSQNQ